jgi:3-deoxy-D-manno-octulosonate 8-phosphate phosphatase (KDO 8-P phosphatase)
MEERNRMDNIIGNIKIIVLDVDGTMTDGSIYIDNNGIETKAFNVKDGFSIVSAQKFGMKFAIITGRKSTVVEKRALELKIGDVYQGVHNKTEKLNELLKKHELGYNNCAYMGDDINDSPAMKLAAFVGVPADAVEEAKKMAHFISTKDGGKGAVREFVDYILQKQGLKKKIVDSYMAV